MAKIETRTEQGQVGYYLAGRKLQNGDELELRLRGNRGWETVTVEGLPGPLRVRTEAYDGKSIVATLEPDADLRWDV